MLLWHDRQDATFGSYFSQITYWPHVLGTTVSLRAEFPLYGSHTIKIAFACDRILDSNGKVQTQRQDSLFSMSGRCAIQARREGSTRRTNDQTNASGR